MGSARRRGDRGVSLVEIMIALSIGSLIAAAGMALAQVFAQVHREQSQIQSLTDNMRGALLQMSQDARLAAAGMSGGDAVNATPSGPVTVPGVRVVNSSTAPDQLELLSVPGSALATTLTGTTVTATALVVDTGGGAAFAAGDFVLLTDFTRAVLYQLQSISATTTSGISGLSLSVPAAPSFPVTSFAPGSLVVRASIPRYSVGLGTAVGMPATSVLLVDDGAPIGVAGVTALAAENIFDLQVALGIDGINGQAADGSLREVGAAANDDEWVFNKPGEALPAAPYALRAVRITLVGRTAVPGATLGPGRPAAEDHGAGTPDFYRWRLQREVIMVRNLVLR